MPQAIEVTQMIECQQTKTSQRHRPVIQLTGSHTIANAEELYRSLRDAVTAHSRIKVTLDEVTHLDAAALQILVAALNDKVVDLNFELPVSDDLRHCFDLAGLAYMLPAG